MANCCVDRPNWTLAESWNLWCVIEHLAVTPSLLNELCTIAKPYMESLVNLGEPDWHSKLDDIAQELAGTV